MVDHVAQKADNGRLDTYVPRSTAETARALTATDDGTAVRREPVVIRRRPVTDPSSASIDLSPPTQLATALRRRRYATTCRWTDPAAALATLGGLWLTVNFEWGYVRDILDARINVWGALLVLIVGAAWQRMLALLGLYDHRQQMRWRSEALAVAVACLLGAVAFPLVSVIATGVHFVIRDVLVLWMASATLVLGARRLAWIAADRRRERRRVLVVGTGARARTVAREIASCEPHGFELVGLVDTPHVELGEDTRRVWIGRLDELERILMTTVVDEVLIALPVKSCYAAIQEVIEVCARSGVESKFLTDIFSASTARPRYDATVFPAVAMSTVHQDDRLIVKRVIDIIGSATALVVLAPLFLVVGVLVKTTSSGPIIFAQERYGLRKRRFRMYKFRTMIAEAEDVQSLLEAHNEAKGPVFKIQEDPRLTRVGRMLRRTSIDELPQLVNVLRGDMTLVGPRPMAVRDVQGFTDAWWMRRFSVPPGITCLWQVSGRSNLTFDDWIRLDLEYIDRWSLALDFEILLRTVPAVVRGTGAM